MLLSINIDKKLLVIILATLLVLIVLYFLFQRMFLSRQVLKAKNKVKTTKKQKKYDLEYIREIAQKSKKYNNTYKKLSHKAKKLVKEFFKRYYRVLIDYIYVFQAKKKQKARYIQILVRNPKKKNKVVYKWKEKNGINGFIKMTNKFKILNELLGFLYALDENIETYNKRKDDNFTVEGENYTISFKMTKK